MGVFISIKTCVGGVERDFNILLIFVARRGLMML